MEKGYEKVYRCMYNWITLLYSRNQHNIVNQLYFNKINLKKYKRAVQVEIYPRNVIWRASCCFWLVCAVLSPIFVLKYKKGSFPPVSIALSLCSFPISLITHWQPPQLPSTGLLIRFSSKHLWLSLMLQNHCRRWLQPWNKDTYSLEGKLWPT